MDVPFWSSCLPARSFGMGGIPLKIPRFWRSMMDCSNNGGRLLRSGITKSVRWPAGVTYCRGQVYWGRQLPKSRPAWVANQSWSCKRVGMQGRGKEQWLSRIIDWAPHQGSVDEARGSVVQQGVDLLWVQVTTSAECTKSIWILPVLGRSYEHGRKGAHRSSNQPMKADGHSFSE
jgi:hypothetical protein